MMQCGWYHSQAKMDSSLWVFSEMELSAINLSDFIRLNSTVPRCASNGNLLVRMIGSNTTEGGFCQHPACYDSQSEESPVKTLRDL